MRRLFGRNLEFDLRRATEHQRFNEGSWLNLRSQGRLCYLSRTACRWH
jgi:hypothetical protein